MPRRSGIKTSKGKHKGKKLSGKNKTSKSAAAHKSEKHADTRSTLTQLRPGERLIHLLKTHPVEKKELYGFKVTTRVLQQLTPQEIRDLRTIFEMFDCNSDGFIGPLDLCRALRTLGFKISRDEAVQVVHDVNVEGRRKINFCEFLEIVIDRQGEDKDTYSEIMKGFEMFDLDDTGRISIEKLHNVCRDAGIKFTHKELEEMMEEADVNGDGYVDDSEFLQIMLKTNLF
uniref:EF-hand domain-containing protein n=1 Tax=Arion vulgaris TaxID=1028688 RepID=A0A0B6Y7P6_9EUPU